MNPRTRADWGWDTPPTGGTKPSRLTAARGRADAARPVQELVVVDDVGQDGVGEEGAADGDAVDGHEGDGEVGFAAWGVCV
jgi:hypothetical protein